jgi:nitrogenase molybdenum-iron protein alpha/beta subunit
MLDFCAESLRYTAPSHGDWGLVRIASLLPESHMLFVCPAACGRHGALGAVDKGYKHRVSYVYVDREDIISGYDKCILYGVEQMLSELEKKPRAVMVYVSCLDSLIATDVEAVMRELSAMHPSVEFRAGRMNPISLEGKTPPAVSTMDAMYSFLNVAETKEPDALNMLGNFVPLSPDGELFRFLKNAGINTTRHISQYETLDGFREMAKSAYNLVLSPVAGFAARNFEAKHGTPFLTLPAAYDLGEIASNYRKLTDFLGAREFGFTEYITAAERAISEAHAAVGGRPISISSAAVLKPFSLARFLIERGFIVSSVVTEEVIALDAVAYEDVKQMGIQVINPLATDVIDFRHRQPDAISIGYDAAYISGGARIVNMSGDQTMFGYHGTISLMQKLAEAAANESDLKQLMDEYGLVV